MKRALKALTAVAALAVAGQISAHTVVKDVLTEDLTTGAHSGYQFNSFVVTHGCGGDSGQPYPVIGQAALFPFGDMAVWRDAAGNVIEVGGKGNGTIVGTTGIGLYLAPDAISGAGSSFPTVNEIVDDLGRVQALIWKNGAQPTEAWTMSPFKIRPPNIANNCVKSVNVRIGVVNYCDKGKNEANDAAGPYNQPKDMFGRPARRVQDSEANDGIQQNVQDAGVYTTMPEGNDDNNRADWWFPKLYDIASGGVNGSGLYSDPEVLQSTYWTTMTVANSAADVAACVAGGGTPVNVSVEPAAEAFDTYLNGANTQPFTKGNGPF